MTTRTNLPAMQRIELGGVELEVHDTGGHGQSLVLVHSPVSEEWLPLLAEPALADHHRIIHYHRRGYGETSNAGLPLDLKASASTPYHQDGYRTRSVDAVATGVQLAKRSGWPQRRPVHPPRPGGIDSGTEHRVAHVRRLRQRDATARSRLPGPARVHLAVLAGLRPAGARGVLPTRVALSGGSAGGPLRRAPATTTPGRGPGTGRFLARAALRPDAELTLLDPNPDVLAYAARRLHDRDVTLVNADVCKPLALDQRFESVGLNLVLHCLPHDHEQVAVQNLARVLEPGGVLFGSTVLGSCGSHTAISRRALRALT